MYRRNVGARNIGELVVSCQSDVTVVCPEGGQRGPEGGWLAPWDLSHSYLWILDISVEFEKSDGKIQD